MFDYTQSAQRIHMWKAHLLRAMNQEAKQHSLSQLDDKTCFIIMDWAMKFLPHHYREQMRDFFGKRGRSWHISAVITKAQKVEVECFVHIFNTCSQNSYTVASMLEHLLCTIKQEQPQISQAFFLRSRWLLQEWATSKSNSRNKQANRHQCTPVQIFRAAGRKGHLRPQSRGYEGPH